MYRVSLISQYQHNHLRYDTFELRNYMTFYIIYKRITKNKTFALLPVSKLTNNYLSNGYLFDCSDEIIY